MILSAWSVHVTPNVSSVQPAKSTVNVGVIDCPGAIVLRFHTILFPDNVPVSLIVNQSIGTRGDQLQVPPEKPFSRSLILILTIGLNSDSVAELTLLTATKKVIGDDHDPTNVL